MSFLQIKDLKVHYPIRGGFFNTVVDHVYAVDGVNMEFDRGKTYGLVGESGSGKSTTGKAIIGLEKLHLVVLFMRAKKYRTHVVIVIQLITVTSK